MAYQVSSFIRSPSLGRFFGKLKCLMNIAPWVYSLNDENRTATYDGRRSEKKNMKTSRRPKK